MLNLYFSAIKKDVDKKTLTDKERLSLNYHDLFDYPMDFADLIKWLPGDLATGSLKDFSVFTKNGFFYKEGREGLIYKRLLRKRISTKKILIAKKASKILSLIPTIKMVGITGSLAMENASQDGDIDLMIITKKGNLWTTRLLSYALLKLANLPIRSSGNKNQKDKLCLNIWLDETALKWNKKDRNIYTAHEIAQIVPLVNKQKTYQFLLAENAWVRDFWPKAVKISKKNIKKIAETKISFVENFFYKIQVKYMKNKITREVIRPNKALFHPQDWGRIVLSHLTS